jgi:molybdopterin-guanine dinucleotide biosynthesis protein A
MGSNKALLKMNNTALIESVYQTLAMLFHEVLIVTNTPEEYTFIPCRKVADIYPGAGSIAGLHAGLAASVTERIFVSACDMPYLNPDVIRLLCDFAPNADAVVPLNNDGLREPLHAVYATSVLDEVQRAIERDDKSILNLLDRIGTTLVAHENYCAIPDAEKSFCNVNTPEEFNRIT